MTWWTRRDPKEIARSVREKTEKWELLRSLDPQLRNPDPQRDRRTPNTADQGDQPSLSTDLLLAGTIMTEWFLEEREHPCAPPKWCLLCGYRGADMRIGAKHALGCGVGAWLRGMEKKY